ncbi:MAG TPA: ABC transporter permease [Candidatus Acidoferrales bacterium]|nr:ABC transporter permease [Candidatus Acidoferrales bacterium]
MIALLHDIRHGLRGLRKSPGFTAVAVLTLALGIGANTAIFTVVDALLLKPLPFADSSQLVLVYQSIEQSRSVGGVFSYPRFTMLRAQQHSFSGLAAYTFDNFNLTGRGDPRQLTAARVTWNFFDVLGVRPELGRRFLAVEGQIGGNHVVMVTHKFWQSKLGGAKDVIGQTLELNSVPYTIVGVLPAEFRFPLLAADTSIWIPREFELNITTQEHIQRGTGYLSSVARLSPGLSLAQAQAEMNVIDAQYRRDNPTMPDADPRRAMMVAPLQSQIVADVRALLLVLMSAVGVVLLIACANVASLMLSRALKRRKEIAVRTALGASRWTIVRQLLTESVLLAMIGGVLGAFAGYAGTRALLAMSQNTVAQLSGGVAMNWSVLVFTLAISLASGVLFGLAPALQFSKTDLNMVLRDEGRSATGGRNMVSSQNALVVVQVALSMILLIGSGLLIRSFLRLMTVSPGFDPNHAVTMGINLPSSKYATPEQIVTFYNNLLREAQTLPGVAAVSISSALPLTPSRLTPMLPEGQTAVPMPQRPLVIIETISPDYAKVMRVPLVSGREFTPEDNEATPIVAIVNQAFVRRFWPSGNPIGRHILIGRNTAQTEVVGVFGDIRNNGIAAEAAPEVMLPFPSLPWTDLHLSVRSAGGDPMALIPEVQKGLQNIDSDQPITHAQTFGEMVADARAQSRFTVVLFGIFSAVALALAIVGIYGVISYAATQRTQEIGIRMALGADRKDIFRLVVGHGLKLAGVGILIGLVAPFTLTRLMSSLLYKVSPADPVTIAASAILFLAAAFFASYVPARRAARVDPMIALRYE